MDVLLLSRLQFALTIMFHYLFPPLTIGLGVVLVYLEGMYLWTKDPLYESAAKFWTKIFGLNFALGVVTGIVMEFEFGTNWAVYSRYVGDVFGSALAAEGIFAFFLESGFLSLLLFGWDRVGPKMHFFATCMVSLGSIFSSIWITVANSWQQTPAGHEIREHMINGQPFLRAEIVDFWALVFNPSTMHRLVHVWLGAFLLGAFFVMSISAWYVLRGRHLEFARRSFTGALILATICSLAQLVSGDLQAKSVAEHQPAKLAAMEGLFETTESAPLYLWGWPDEEAGEVKYGVAIPGMLSLLIHHDTAAEVPGLNDLDEQFGTPPVWLTFQSYHAMIGIGMVMIAATLLASYWRWRGTLFEKRAVMWFFVLAVGLAVAGNELGWVAAEVGRQPWVVYPTIVDGQAVGGLRTSDALSESVSSGQVLGSIIAFGLVYLLLFALWVMLLHQKISHGPEPVAPADRPEKAGLLAAAASMAAHEGSLTEESRGASSGG
ncbi:MAG: cytochrome ubiquinol oxidase subunit I [Planctomycetaceae bacterium]|nr:cytochrome ubiquinol oxidase subunit I [Planctomycetaceae bacterium]